MNNQNIEFKKSYTLIFSLNYLFQGFTTSMFAVIVPIYLLSLITSSGASITASGIEFIGSIILIPSAIKLLYGILIDKYGSKKLGHRRPWILFPVSLAGAMWIVLPFLISPANAIVMFVIIGFIINVGVMMGDTALDGLILDICPKERLGRIQGICWGFRSIGQIAGGPVLAFLIVIIDFISAETTFIILGILMILSSLFILYVQELKKYPIIQIKENLKEMFTHKRDYKTYSFALFNSIMDGVVLLFISLYILIQLNLVLEQGTSLSLGAFESDVYIFQANISFIISGGIIIGAIIGGAISDLVSRKLSVYFSVIAASISMFLMVISLNDILFFIFAFIIGITSGWRHSSYSAVIGEIAKKHESARATYFALCNSFTNLGTTLGLTLAGLILDLTGEYVMVFIIMALLQTITLLPFFVMEKEEYELKKVLNK